MKDTNSGKHESDKNVQKKVWTLIKNLKRNGFVDQKKRKKKMRQQKPKNHVLMSKENLLKFLTLFQRLMIPNS